MKYPTSLQDPRYPKFIRENEFIKMTKIRKSFAGNGLKDNRVKYSFIGDNTPADIKIHCSSFISRFKKMLSTVVKSYEAINRKMPYPWFSSAQLIRTKQDIDTILTMPEKSFLAAGRFVLPAAMSIYSILEAEVMDFSEHHSLLDVVAIIEENCVEMYGVSKGWNELLLRGAEIQLARNKNLQIVFSTHPWDIATISMRGIRSCQTWGQNQEDNLIGSILDPHCGVIYLTDGKAHGDMGERMLARSIVRSLSVKGSEFNKLGQPMKVISEKTDKLKFPMIENAYSDFTYGKCPIDLFDQIFMSNILHAGKGSFKLRSKGYELGILMEPEVKQLPENMRSYRDSDIPYFERKTEEVKEEMKKVA